MPEPVQVHERETDQYGYAAFDGNYYWIPGKGRGRVQVLQYSSRIEIFKNRERLAEYLLPAFGVKNERLRPSGVPEIRQFPNNCKRPTGAEENRLKAMAPQVARYLEFLVKQADSSQRRYRLIRGIHSLSQKLAPELFIQAISRAHRYRIADLGTIERIAQQLLRENSFEMESWTDLDEEIQSRASYRDGELSEPPDLSRYEDRLNCDTDDDSDGGINGQGS
ncbi:MAG: hypothetical protein EB121_01470 [Alphaproteobacteria bacterium]|nr:hypothetical protein [Alphaproteobacteria bacterium]